jgi:TonB family protein
VPTLFVVALVSMVLAAGFTQLRAQTTKTEALHAGVAGVGTPSCVHCPKPGYPEEALKAKYEGDVYLVGIIGVDGHATRLKVLDPGLGLGRKALNAVKAWRFQPALGADGRPIPVITTIDVRFNLPPEQK